MVEGKNWWPGHLKLICVSVHSSDRNKIVLALPLGATIRKNKHRIKESITKCHSSEGSGASKPSFEAQKAILSSRRIILFPFISEMMLLTVIVEKWDLWTWNKSSFSFLPDHHYQPKNSFIDFFSFFQTNSSQVKQLRKMSVKIWATEISSN